MSTVIAKVGAKTYRVNIPDALVDGEIFQFVLDGKTRRATLIRKAGLLVLHEDGGLERHLRWRTSTVAPGEEGSETAVSLEIFLERKVQNHQAVLRPDIPGHDQRLKDAAGREQVVKSQITGKVLKVLIKPGEMVEAGTALIVIEAMKMENRVFSQAPGKITSVSVKDGDAVQTGKELVRIAPPVKT